MKNNYCNFSEERLCINAISVDEFNWKYPKSLWQVRAQKKHGEHNNQEDKEKLHEDKKTP